MFNTKDYGVIPAYAGFCFWFNRIDQNRFECLIYLNDEENPGGKRIGIVTETTEGLLYDADVSNYTNKDATALDLNFEMFKQRPEYFVGLKCNLVPTDAASNSAERMQEFFENVIVGSAAIRARNAGKNPDDAFAPVSKFIEWLRGTDFFYCPGSTKFHDAEPVGLLFHSLTVYNNMIELKKINKFEYVPYHSIALLSLCHDFTKIGNYEQYMRNVKNDETGQWEKVPSYRWKCNPFPFGHGVASLYIITRFFQLSLEEMLAIRWHMGEYNVSDREGGELEDACENYPMVRMLQFADQLACVKY
jgi:hypothetical protein